jgi:hypothetical protein
MGEILQKVISMSLIDSGNSEINPICMWLNFLSPCWDFHVGVGVQDVPMSAIKTKLDTFIVILNVRQIKEMWCT